MKNLKVIITGCGFKPVGKILRYKNKPTHASIFMGGGRI